MLLLLYSMLVMTSYQNECDYDRGLKSDTTAHLMMRKTERLKKLKVRAAQRNKMPGTLG